MTTGSGSQPCRWCDTPIRPDGRGEWVHTTGLYRCRDAQGIPTDHFAQPQSSTPQPVIKYDQ